MRRIFNFGKKETSLSESTDNSRLSAGYELKDKDLSQLHKAASHGDLVKLTELIVRKKKDVNQLDKKGRSALHIASAAGHDDVVSFLLENRARLNLCDAHNRTALMKAVQGQHEDCAHILLDHGADPNLVDVNGNTALHLAANIPSVNMAGLLLEHPMDINASNQDSLTPLALAVCGGHTEMAEFLLKEGADVDGFDKDNRSPLMIAAGHGFSAMIQLLLRNDADVSLTDNKGRSAKDYADMNGHHSCSNLITEHETVESDETSSEDEDFKDDSKPQKKDPRQELLDYLKDVADWDSDSTSSEDDASENQDLDSEPRATGENERINEQEMVKEEMEDNKSSNVDYNEKNDGRSENKINVDEIMEALGYSDEDDFETDTKPQSLNMNSKCVDVGEGKDWKEVFADYLKDMATWDDSSSEEDVPEDQGLDSEPQAKQEKERINEQEMSSVNTEMDEYQSSNVDKEEKNDGSLQKLSGNTKWEQLVNKPAGRVDEEALGLSDVSEFEDDSDTDHSLTEAQQEPSAENEETSEPPINEMMNIQEMSSVKAETEENESSDVGFDEEETGQEEEDGEERQEREQDLDDVSSIPETDTSDEEEDLRTEVSPGKDGQGSESDLEETDLLQVEEENEIVNKEELPSVGAEMEEFNSHVGYDEEKNYESLKEIEKTNWEPTLNQPAFCVDEMTDLTDALGLSDVSEFEDDSDGDHSLTEAQPEPSAENEETSEPPSEEMMNIQEMSSVKAETEENESCDVGFDEEETGQEEEDEEDEEERQEREHDLDEVSSIPETDTSDEEEDLRTEVSPGKEGAVQHLSESEWEDIESENEEEQPTAGVEKEEFNRHVDNDEEKTGREEEEEEDEQDDASSIPETDTSDKEGRDLRTEMSPGKDGKGSESDLEETDLLQVEAEKEMVNKEELPSVGAEMEEEKKYESLKEVQNTNGESLLNKPEGNHDEKTNFKEDLGLGDENDEEDASDSDSTSIRDHTLPKHQEFPEISEPPIGKTESAGSVPSQCSFNSTSESESPSFSSEYSSIDSSDNDDESTTTQMKMKRFNLSRRKMSCFKIRKGSAQVDTSLSGEESECETAPWTDSSPRLPWASPSQMTSTHSSSFEVLSDDDSDLNEYMNRQEEEDELVRKSIELEPKTLVDNMKQLEEDHSETQRLLVQEHRAPTPEDLLNRQVHEQQELQRENSDRDLLEHTFTLEEQIRILRGDLEHTQANSSVKEMMKLQEENEALKEQLEDAQREAKAHNDALIQTVFNCKHQLTALKSELDSTKTHLATAVQKVELCSAEKADAEKALLREKAETERLKDRLIADSAIHREAVSSLSLKLSKAESDGDSLKNELHRVTLQLTERCLLLDVVQKEKEQLAAQVESLNKALQAQKERLSKTEASHEVMQQRVMLVEERNRELASQTVSLKNQVCRSQEEKSQREETVRQLQQELTNARSRLSQSEASLEVNTRRRSTLEEENARVCKDLERLREKLAQSQDQNEQADNRFKSLKNSFTDKEKELTSSIQKLQEALSDSSSSAATIKALEQALQTQELQTARLEEDFQSRLVKETLLRNHLETEMREALTKAKEVTEQKNTVDVRLNQEKNRNTELQTEMSRLKTLLKKAKKKLHDQNLGMDQKHQELLELRQKMELTQREQSQTEDRARRERQHKLEQRIQKLESEASHSRCTLLDSLNQQKSMGMELERYKSMYSEELRQRQTLAAKLEKANARLTETYSQLVCERSKSLLDGSLVDTPLNGGAEGSSLGNLGLNQSLGLSPFSPFSKRLSDRGEDIPSTLKASESVQQRHCRVSHCSDI